MSKDPAFLFYTQDFLTGTMFMTNEETGIYIKLLCAQHQHGGLINKNAFNNLVGDNTAVKEKFIETSDGFYNKRLMEEIVKRAKKSSNLSKNAKKRWEKAKQKQCKSNAIASDLHMPIENENENEIKDKKRKRFIPPTPDEVESFFLTNGFSAESAKRAFDYYSEAEWHDSKGNKVKNWKQKMRGVWFKDENKIHQKVTEVK